MGAANRLGQRLFAVKTSKKNNGGVIMSTKQAMWVHGTSVQAEREGYFISKSRYGWGVAFLSQGTEWFHSAVPTPVIFGGAFSNLEKFFVLFKTGLGAHITNIHLYDGITKIKTFDNLNLAGDYTNSLVNEISAWTITPVHINWGLGISICVNFGQATPAGVPEITFTSVGADFTIS
jgi:hypothetical protein